MLCRPNESGIHEYFQQCHRCFRNGECENGEWGTGKWAEEDKQNKPSPVPTIHISTRISADNSRLLIRISDNGPGMIPEIKKRIFDPFYTTKPVGRGTGLGLAISYQIIVEKHGGIMECISEPGQRYRVLD